MAQTIEIYGKVESSVNIENIHVINATAQKFTITDQNGAFRIPVKLNDTVSFSSVQHEPKDIIITSEILRIRTISVRLKEKINTLDEVFVGKILTGDLSSDIGNVGGEMPVNFFDLGIPGYTGKLATQSERRLHEATTGAGIVPLNPIINAITGRTKMLKQRIQHENNDALLKRIRIDLSESLFALNPLEEEFRMDFFFFCEMDPNFFSRCNGKTDLEVLDFLREKLKEYKINQAETKN
ncbi:hypothetical protein H7U19_02830 [Hyunsoonleella sp. SJ7]|uniref:Carboxypeptidase-like regulatory domain-containing protein n=2 Tax=Hyunsoonleella aquatilis TaxID=2762758 RepID=A0A923H7R5_9FLAO|nr:hypothetical protein [Hyunsoonleella aquatilis]